MAKPIVPEELWQLFAQALPPAKDRHVLHAGRRASGPRRILAGIIYALTMAVPWEHLPAASDFDPGQSQGHHAAIAFAGKDSQSPGQKGAAQKQARSSAGRPGIRFGASPPGHKKKGIKPLLARRGTPHGSGLGRKRWVVERTLS